MKKLVPYVAVLLVGVALGAVVMNVRAPAHAPAAPPPPAAAAAPAQPAPVRRVEDPKAVYRVALEDSPARGSRDALVTVVESLDFECPFCKRVAPTLAQVEEAYRGKLRVVFKHNPLSMHANAVPAAVLAEEARAQGGDAKFWAVHDRLLAAPSLDRAALEKVAKEAGLAPAEVKAALDGSRYVDRIRRDQNLVNGLGATGTPTFFVNGRKLVGAQPVEAFEALIDEELAKAEALANGGVARRDVYARITERGATAPVLVEQAAAQAAVANVRVRQDDPARGPAGARITIVEFSDFQCPFCSRALPAVKDVEREFGKDVRIVWKHLPLPFHPNAEPAAVAAEAARQQGKFWEMHDRLFAAQQALSDATYAQAAKELGLDLARFEAARRAPATLARVREDAAAAAVAGVTGTPTFVVNGELVLGSSGLRAAVERQLTRVARR